jgi:hypothetical protein
MSLKKRKRTSNPVQEDFNKFYMPPKRLSFQDEGETLQFTKKLNKPVARIQEEKEQTYNLDQIKKSNLFRTVKTAYIPSTEKILEAKRMRAQPSNALAVYSNTALYSDDDDQEAFEDYNDHLRFGSNAVLHLKEQEHLQIQNAYEMG